MGHSHQNTSDGHQTEWVLCPIFFNGWKLFFKDFINVYILEYFCEQFIYILLCYVIYFSLLIWHTQSSVDPFSILSASDVCECHKVLYVNPFCPMAIRCPSDVKYFWCERAIREFYHLPTIMVLSIPSLSMLALSTERYD